MKTLSMLFIAVLVVSLLLGCGGGGETPTITPTPTTTPTIMNLIDLVPQEANVIALGNVSVIINDQDISGLWQAMPLEPDMPQTLDEALRMAEEESNIDVRDFEQVLMFGESLGAIGELEYFGVLAKGTFEERDLVASIESGIDEQFTAVSYKGYEIYTDSDEEGGLAFLSSYAFVIGSMDAVRDVIDINEGIKPAISGKVLDTYDELGDTLMKMAVLVPPGAIEETLQEFMSELAGELPIDLTMLEPLADMETMGVALAKNDQAIVFATRMCFTSSDSAEYVGDFVSLMMAMMGMIGLPEDPGLIPIPEEGQELLQELLPELLDKLEVNTTDACLIISLELTPDEIEELLAE